MAKLLQWALQPQNVVLLLIAAFIYTCARGLKRIHQELECMHEDFEAVHNAHEIIAQRRQIEADESLAKRSRAKDS